MSKHRKINIGDVFGRLTVMEDLGIQQAFPTKRHRMYRCNCMCGKQTIVAGTLLGKLVNSCGCIKRIFRSTIYQPGTRFGRLVIISWRGSVRTKGHRYQCKCDCGKEKYAYHYNLRAGNTTSCGCLHDELFYETSKSKNLNSIVDGTHLGRIKSNTVNRNNTSGFRGINWHRNNNKWYARITFQGISYSLGYHDDIKDAVKARKKSEKELFGKYLKQKGF